MIMFTSICSIPARGYSSRLRLEGETESNGVCAKKRKGMRAVVLWATPGVQRPACPPARGSRWMTADLVQDAALDTNTKARMKTKASQLPGRGCGLSVVILDPFTDPWVTVI